MQDAEADLSLVIVDLANNFFPWKDPRTDLQKAIPWIQLIISALLGFIPYIGSALSAAVNFADWSPGIVSTAQVIASSGVQAIGQSGVDSL